ncbi:MAG: PD-(D/E)XK nuclease family transposase [Planctomycetota bacterium]|nr:PD-(D/E)XK nuclease family transposase [Planctomycetota bacterium]
MNLMIDLKNDFAFKRVLSNENHLEVLVHVINAVLGLTGDDRVVSVTILNPNITTDDIHDAKDLILDVRAVDQMGRQFNLEMQMFADIFVFPKRIQTTYPANCSYPRF